MERMMVVAGARPNFMKVGPLLRELDKQNIVNFFVHTGQHYDENLSNTFLRKLCPKKPDILLSGTVTQFTAGEKSGKIINGINAAIEIYKPEVVIVVGDVNSTLWAAITAKKAGVKVAHVEAGLRSYDWAMEEEVNRVVVDSISDFLFCTDERATGNCFVNSRKDHSSVHMVGNIMADNLYWIVDNFSTGLTRKGNILSRYEVKDEIFLTIHRPQNLKFEFFYTLFGALAEINKRVIFPVHPRTMEFLEKHCIKPPENVKLHPPMSYIISLNHWSRSKIVITDSGGLQEETTMAGVPCLTLRNSTERPITVDKGTNVLYPEPRTAEGIADAIEKYAHEDWACRREPIPYWDGKTAERIIKILREAKP